MHFLKMQQQAFSGVYEDKSGPEMAKLLTEMSDNPSWPLQLHIKFTAVVPDEPGTTCSQCYIYQSFIYIIVPIIIEEFLGFYYHSSALLCYFISRIMFPVYIPEFNVYIMELMGFMIMQVLYSIYLKDCHSRICMRTLISCCCVGCLTATTDWIR